MASEDQNFRFSPGDTPLLVSVPHAGVTVPAEIFDGMTETARRLPDTDWHVDRLYGFAADLGAGLLVATWSRYVVDLNRDPGGADLYPGADNTGLCPTTTFAEDRVHVAGAAPDGAEIEDRIKTYWRPYHARLEEELGRLKDRHGFALLYDAHSIRSRVPRFFDGELPTFNIGTGDEQSADAGLGDVVEAVCRSAPGCATARNGRFKGGYITRAHGDPKNHLHAVQMELAQKSYMDEETFTYGHAPATALQASLRSVLEAMLRWGRDRYGRR